MKKMNIDYCYQVFNLPKTASPEEIHSRYRELYDLFNPKSPYANEQRYKEIIEAYWTIRCYLKKQQEMPLKFVVEKKKTTNRLAKPLIMKGSLVLAGVAGGLVIVFSGITLKNAITSNNIDNPFNKDTILETENPVKESYFVDSPPTSIPAKDGEVVPNRDVSLTENGFLLEIIDGVTYIDGQLVVNKSYPLPSDYEPKTPFNPITEEKGIDYLEETALNAFHKMQDDASKQGLNLWIASGYRSYDYQSRLYAKYVRLNGVDIADTFSARPGYSEHQTGLAFDLNSVSISFATTPEGRWVAENCYKYGFIIRYPKGKSEQTGYIYEPWHLRFVGLDLALKLYNGGYWTTMEEYYGIKSVYEKTEIKEGGRTK